MRRDLMMQSMTREKGNGDRFGLGVGIFRVGGRREV